MARSVVGSLLLLLGSLLVAIALALVGQAYLGLWMHDLRRPATAQELLPARLESVPAAPSPPVVQERSAPMAQATSTAIPSAADVTSAAPVPAGPATVGAPAGPPEANPTPRPNYGPPVRMVIPSIDLDSTVMEVGIKNGVYEVPGWDVGWHKDSAPLGMQGNTLFNGHLQTIDAGRVFASLHQVRPGDMIYLYSPTHRTAWVVESSERVANSDHDFVAQTGDVRLTLYTCEGDFDWNTRRYSHYRVVVARLVEAAGTEAESSDATPRYCLEARWISAKRPDLICDLVLRPLTFPRSDDRMRAMMR